MDGRGGTGGRNNSANSERSGGGAGNPGGYGAKFVSGWLSSSNKGEDGTGGLLIIYSNNIENNGNITSNGSSGGNDRLGGGSSGGGTINIFYKNSYIDSEEIKINVNGGLPLGTYRKGGEGRSRFDISGANIKWYIYK